MPDPVDDVNDALRQLVRTIERGSLSVFEALTRFSRIIGGRGAQGGGQGTQSQQGGANPAIANMFSGMILKITAVIAPLASFATILAQANSGFSLLTGAFQILAATVAPILLPFFVLLAAGLMTVSDMIWAQLLPNLKDWYLLILNEGVPAVAAFIKALTDAVGWIKERIDELQGKQKGGPKGFVEDKDLGDLLLDPNRKDELEKAFMKAFGPPPGMKEGIGAVGGGLLIGGGPGPKPKNQTPQAQGDGLIGKLLKNIDLVTQQFAFQIGSKPSFSGLAEASKQAQMAAFQPPFEQKSLQLMQQSLKALQDAVGELQGIRLEHKPAPAVGPGGN